MNFIAWQGEIRLCDCLERSRAQRQSWVPAGEFHKLGTHLSDSPLVFPFSRRRRQVSPASPPPPGLSHLAAQTHTQREAFAFPWVLKILEKSLAWPCLGQCWMVNRSTKDLAKPSHTLSVTYQMGLEHTGTTLVTRPSCRFRKEDAIGAKHVHLVFSICVVPRSKSKGII